MSEDRHSQASARGQQAQEYRPNGDATSPTATEDASAPHAADDLEQKEVAEPDALKLLARQFRELVEYVSYYLAAKTDSAKLSLRNTVLWIAFAALGFVVVAGLIITATWILLNGVAEGVSLLFGGRLWAGRIVTGAVLLVGLGLAMYFTVAARRILSRRRLVRKYEQRQARQEARFGRNVLDRTAATVSQKK